MATPVTATEFSSANTFKLMYECPSTSTYAIVAVKVLNTDPTNNAIIRIAVSTQATTANPSPANDEYIEYATTLAPKTGMERGSIIMAPGEKLVIWSNTSTVAFRVHGLERITSNQAVSVAKSSPSQGSWNTIYTTPTTAGTKTVNYGTYHINILNNGGSAGDLDLAISPASPPLNKTLIEREQTLQANGDGLIHTCNIMVPGEKVLIKPTIGTMIIRVAGIMDLNP